MNLRKIINKESGLSLIESTIYIAIVGIVGIGLMVLVVNLVKLKASANSMSIISSETPKVLDKILTDIHGCDSFSVDSPTSLSIVKGAETDVFYLEDGSLFVNENGIISQLSSDLVEIENIEFIDWTSVNSDNLLFVSMQIRNGEISEYYELNVNTR